MPERITLTVAGPVGAGFSLIRSTVLLTVRKSLGVDDPATIRALLVSETSTLSRHTSVMSPKFVPLISMPSGVRIAETMEGVYCGHDAGKVKERGCDVLADTVP